VKKFERKIIVVGTLIERKAHYVKTLDQRPGGQFNATLTMELKHAMEFESRRDAEKKKDKINNPYERHYEVEEKKVDWPVIAAISVPGDLK
jgi:hypothetical protein